MRSDLKRRTFLIGAVAFTATPTIAALPPTLLPLPHHVRSIGKPDSVATWEQVGLERNWRQLLEKKGTTSFNQTGTWGFFFLTYFNHLLMGKSEDEALALVARTEMKMYPS